MLFYFRQAGLPRPQHWIQLHPAADSQGGCGYYRQHIPAFASITQPLNAITGSTSPKTVQWNPSLDTAFNKAKQAFLEAPILSAPDLTQPYHLYADACSTGIGAALTQAQDGKMKHIAFYSKQLTPAQAHYYCLDNMVNDNKRLMRWTTVIVPSQHPIHPWTKEHSSGQPQ